MGAVAPRPLTRQAGLLGRFARLMRDRYGADIHLFGSRARGTARPDSDYDIVAVADSFGSEPWYERGRAAGDLWIDAGGWRLGLDLQCYTPAEFRAELAGLGFVGLANARGELRKIEPTIPPSRRRVKKPVGQASIL